MPERAQPAASLPKPEGNVNVQRGEHHQKIAAMNRFWSTSKTMASPHRSPGRDGSLQARIRSAWRFAASKGAIVPAFAPGGLLSILLHGVVLVLLALALRTTPPFRPAMEWASVEIVDEAEVPRPQPPAPSPVPGPARPSAPVPGAASGPIRAEHMLSGALLSGPYGAAMKRELGQMEGETRTMQLCNIEAMAQIDRWQANGAHARGVVAYARSTPRLQRSVFRAAGAAVDLRGHWFRLSYSCELAGDGTVSGFEFKLGSEIGAEDWERFSLPPPGQFRLD